MSGIEKEEGAAAIRSHFEFFDNDDDGYIDFIEFKELLEAIAPGVELRQIGTGFSMIDKDSDGYISFAEFETWWGSGWDQF